MSGTSNLDVTYVSASQNQKEVTINAAFDAFDAAMSDAFAVLFSGNAATITAAEFVGNIAFVCSGQTAAATLTVPLSKRLFVVDNSAGTYQVTVAGATGASVVVPAAASALIRCDGTNCVVAATQAPAPSALLDQLGAVQGDLVYRGASGWVVLAPGTAGQVLATGGATANPAWATPSVAAATVVESSGTTIDGAAVALNFTGAGVTLTDASHVVTIDIPGGGGGGALSVIEGSTTISATTIDVGMGLSLTGSAGSATLSASGTLWAENNVTYPTFSSTGTSVLGGTYTQWLMTNTAISVADGDCYRFRGTFRRASGTANIGFSILNAALTEGYSFVIQGDGNVLVYAYNVTQQSIGVASKSLTQVYSETDAGAVVVEGQIAFSSTGYNELKFLGQILPPIQDNKVILAGASFVVGVMTDTFADVGEFMIENLSIPGGVVGVGTPASFYSGSAAPLAIATAPTLTTGIDSMTLSLPASLVDRQVSVSGVATWTSGSHGMRGVLMLDATQVFPATDAFNPIATGDAYNVLMCAGVPIDVPGDGSTHEISMAWSAQTSTAGFTLYDRWLTGSVVGIGGVPFGPLVVEAGTLSFEAATLDVGTGLSLTGSGSTVTLSADRGMSEGVLSPLPTQVGTGFTTNAGGGTVTDTAAGLTLSTSSTGVWLTKAPPAAPVSYSTLMQITGAATAYSQGGIGFSDGTKSQLLVLQYNTGWEIVVNDYSAVNTYVSEPFTGTPSATGASVWLKVRNDGTTLDFSCSSDGANFYTLYTAGLTSYLANADTIVLYGGPGGGTTECYTTFASLTQGT